MVDHPKNRRDGDNLIFSKFIHYAACIHSFSYCQIAFHCRDFPGGALVKNPPANAGDTGLIPGPGRSHMPWSN